MACKAIGTNSDEKGGETGQLLEALWQASMEAEQPPVLLHRQPCLPFEVVGIASGHQFDAAADLPLVSQPCER